MARILKLQSPLMKGSDVKQLQYNLNGLNYNCGKVDGYFGKSVDTAVKSFQKEYGLGVDGIVGTNTWEKLKSEVKKIQNKLNDLNYDCGYADGYFGSGTINAVKDFQRDNSLSADGIVGYRTRKKLFSSTSPQNPTDVTISFSSGANKSVVNSHAINVLKQILKNANLSSAKITSTIRTPEKQASAMYNNCERDLQKQKQLYGSTGDQVIAVYEKGKKSGKSRTAIIKDMTNKIEDLWPKLVSKHCVSPEMYAHRNVIDIGMSSISNNSKFEKQLKIAENNGSISKYIPEPYNSCHHVEINIP